VKLLSFNFPEFSYFSY